MMNPDSLTRRSLLIGGTAVVTGATPLGVRADAIKEGSEADIGAEQTEINRQQVEQCDYLEWGGTDWVLSSGSSIMEKGDYCIISGKSTMTESDEVYMQTSLRREGTPPYDGEMVRIRFKYGFQSEGSTFHKPFLRIGHSDKAPRQQPGCPDKPKFDPWKYTTDIDPMNNFRAPHKISRPDSDAAALYDTSIYINGYPYLQIGLSGTGDADDQSRLILFKFDVKDCNS